MTDKAGCIISSFYIKPQHSPFGKMDLTIVLYLHSTSNHNPLLYYTKTDTVVLYLHSTSNHNSPQASGSLSALYYIFILHQTTTRRKGKNWGKSCIISSFYIKPQLMSILSVLTMCCIISSFYIKPQPWRTSVLLRWVVLYLHSTSNHNFVWHSVFRVELYYIFILHQTTTVSFNKDCFLQLYYIFILHQTTTMEGIKY